MMNKNLFHTFLISIAGTVVILFSTASACDSSTVSSSDGVIKNDARYEFSKVSLSYDYSSRNDRFNDMSLDTPDLYRAHGVDPTKMSGIITDLSEILKHEDEYPADRKPEITITIKPQAKDDVVYHCTKYDVGSNYVSGIPNYGCNINTLIVSVKSIVTDYHKLQLCWSKSFELNQNWWDFYQDTALSGKAEVKVGGYSKLGISDEVALIRKNGDKYTLITCNKTLLAKNGVIDCDVEFLPSSSTPISTTLSKPIYVKGKFENELAWEAPMSVKLL